MKLLNGNENGSYLSIHKLILNLKCLLTKNNCYTTEGDCPEFPIMSLIADISTAKEKPLASSFDIIICFFIKNVCCISTFSRSAKANLLLPFICANMYRFGHKDALEQR